MKRKIKHLSFIFLLAAGFSSIGDSEALAAKDDITGITLEQEMRDLIQLGILKGYSEGEYLPEKDVTRGQFTALISRALKLPDGTPKFQDVKGSRIAAEIYQASSANIVKGYNENIFGINDPVTREQMAQIIDNALVYLKLDRKEATLSFTDVDKINQRFIIAVERNVHDQIVSGYPDGEFKPQKTATRAEAAAFISRMLNTAKIDIPKEPPAPEEPKQEVDTYKVAIIDGNKKLVTGSESYKTYADAKKAATESNQVITFNNKIISMSSGLVISNPSTGKATTTIYEEPGFKNSMTYVPPQSEMEYIESTDQYVKVNLAGRQGYVQQSEVTLLPYQQVEKRNYYSVNANSELVFTIYNQSTKGSFSYVVGKAPTFLTQGDQYYSWDGGVFFNKAGQKVGTAYQYFNYLPVRTVTNYSAAELDAYIDHALRQRENLYESNPVSHARYKDATKNSKLLGLGTALKEAEKNERINALIILSIAINESDFGMSSKALTKNNLFGINAVDSNPDQADSFKTPEDSIKALTGQYFNEKYLNLTRTFYANGAALGNKAIGVNVRYASDPYWGQKNASHMYQADQYLGSRDFGKYKIGLTNTKELNARSGPTTKDKIIFTYPKAGMPVAILDSTQTWYKVLSDHPDAHEVYIHGSYITPVSIVE